MALAQALACREDEKKPDVVVKSEKLEVADAEKLEVTEAEDAARLWRVNKCEDGTTNLKPSSHLKKENVVNDHEKVDVVNCSGSTASALVKDDDPDATEYSSSFGNTFSGSDWESKRILSDMEVDSPCFDPNDNSIVQDGYKRVFKKKKVTAHWRNFIRPLVWRSHWLELRMNELLSQASKYDKELTSYKHEKNVQAKIIELNNSASRLVPLALRSHKRESMRRRKRRRDENMTDVSSYMANHVVYSYYEKKKMETDEHIIDDNYGDVADDNIKGNDDDGFLALNSSDSGFELILSNIQGLQSRIAKLKTHLNKVLCQNNIEMYPCDLLPGYRPASYAHSVSGSPRTSGAAAARVPNTSPHRASNYEMDDIVMPGSAVSSYGDAADPDIIDTTVALLGHHSEDLLKETSEDVLIDNHMTDKDDENLENLRKPIENMPDLVKKEPESSGDESTAPEISLPETRARKKVSKPLEEVIKHCYSGKKRGRKPKNKQLGGSVAASGLWRSERLRKKRRLSGKKT